MVWTHTKTVTRTIPKTILEWQPTGKRPVGRPRLRWMYGVEEALQCRGTSVMEVENDATFDDRVAWRRLVRFGD